MESDGKRVLIALVLSVGLLWGWSTFIMPEKPKPQPQPTAAVTQVNQTNTAAPPPPAAGNGQTPAQAVTPDNQPPQDVVVDTPLYKAVFSTRGGTLRKVVLKKFYEEVNQQGGNMVLLELEPREPYSLGLAFAQIDPYLAVRSFTTDGKDMTVTQNGQTLSFTRNVSGINVTKTYTFDPDSYAFNLKVTIANPTGNKYDLVPELTLAEYVSKKDINFYAFTGSQMVAQGGLVEKDHGDLEDKPVVTGNLDFISMSIPYFMGAVAPGPWPQSAVGKDSFRGSCDEKVMTATLVSPHLALDAGQTMDLNYLVYYGPKELSVLEPLGHNLAMAVDFGWFDFFAKPMLAGLKFFYGYVKNYGVAIIIITILIKLIFWPLQNKSYQSMKRMQKLQPQMKKIREKYKDDKQEQNQQIMQLYKTYKVNPLGGCLPMVVQIPIFIAFYKVLGSSIELRHAPFMLWINDLAAPDRLPIGFDIPFVGAGIPVLTLLMGASMFLTQKMTPSTGDPTQQKMMMLMPIIFTIMFINFPSGLVLYWFVQNLLGIGQQYLVNRRKD